MLMKIVHSHYASQVENTVDQAGEHGGPGYSAKQLCRFALLDSRREIEVAKLEVVAQNGESETVFVMLFDLPSALARLLEHGEHGPKAVTVTIDDGKGLR